jgi:hypothetical protein
VARLTRCLAAALALLPLSARADKLELLGPATTASPDGFEVAVRLTDDQGRALDAKAVKIDVAGAQASAPKADGLARVLSVVPSDRKVTVTATAGAVTATRTFAVGPPAARG